MVIATLILNAVLVAGCGQSARYLPQTETLAVWQHAGGRVARTVARVTAGPDVQKAPTAARRDKLRKPPIERHRGRRTRSKVWVPEPLPGSYAPR